MPTDYLSAPSSRRRREDIVSLAALRRAIHRRGDPSPTEMAELLGVFMADEDRGPLVISEPSSWQ